MKTRINRLGKGWLLCVGLGYLKMRVKFGTESVLQHFTKHCLFDDVILVGAFTYLLLPTKQHRVAISRPHPDVYREVIWKFVAWKVQFLVEVV